MKKNRLTFIFLLLTTIVIAQEEKDSLSINDLYIDYSVPDFSAFNMLGVDADKVEKPGNLKQFSAGLVNFLGSDNTIQSGLATELSPRNFNKKRDESWWYRKFRYDNWALSLATANDDSIGTLVSGAIKWVPIDNTEAFADQEFYDEIVLAVSSITHIEFEKLRKDGNEFENYLILKLKDVSSDENQLYINLDKILTNSIAFEKNKLFYANQKKVVSGAISNPIRYFADTVSNSLTAVGVGQLTPQDSLVIINFSSKYVSWLTKSKNSDETVSKKIKEIKDKYKKKNWYKSSMMISAGLVGNSEENKYQELSYRNFSAIVSGSIGFELKKFQKTNAQLILQVKTDGAMQSKVEYTNRYSFGGRLLIGNSDNRLSIEGLYSATQLSDDFITPDFDQIKYFRWSAGVELKVTDGTWLELAIGGQRMFEGDDGTAILPNFVFKHAIQSKKRYN